MKSALPLVLILLIGCGRLSHPSDERLLKNFERNEEQFSRLLTMLRTDKKLQRVDRGWTRPEDPSSIGISPERIAEYRQTFSKLGIPRGFYAFHDPEHFTFIVSTWGLSISGSAKGYAFMEKKPHLLVNNLDTYRSPDGKSYTAYRHIKGNWYLYHDFED